jgi:hypothetical protein
MCYYTDEEEYNTEISNFFKECNHKSKLKINKLLLGASEKCYD